ncbi:MAG: hypothetical protein AB8B74_14180 [Crocinitomicaceae bacterium]
MRRYLLLALVVFQLPNVIGQSCSPNSLITREIRAVDTDSNINWELQKHQVFLNPDCIQNDKLVIHLVGSYDNPANTSYFPALAANNGFKAIVLKYPNNTAALTACGNSNNVNCFRQFRKEIIYGIDSSSTVTVDTNNCIINRIEKLLSHLNSNYPNENWDNFLTASGNINWPYIIISGHSQGGGHAAFIGKQNLVSRVLMFASPNDYSANFAGPANWVSMTSATPNSRYFAFGNLFDDVVDYSNQFQIWDLMGLIPADSINVDHSVCNYNNSHALYTAQHDPSASFSTCHNNVIIDDYTPLLNGTPTFTSVWKYMLGLCDLSSIFSKATERSANIKLFPNPASSIIQIESPEKVSSIKLFSCSGTLLKIDYPNKEIFTQNLESYKGVLFILMTLEETGIQVYKKVIMN